MSNFHSTISRRNFMKAIGLMGAGVGVAGATTPVFHDLDELVSSPNAAQGRNAWWVKERDYMDLTTEVDWNIYQRFRSDLYNNGLMEFKTHFGDKADAIQAAKNANVARQSAYTEETKPGSGRRAQALKAVSHTNLTDVMSRYNDGSHGNVFYGDEDLVFKMGRNSVFLDTINLNDTWKGSPEENARMMRTVCRFFGFTDTRYLPLDEKTIKLLNTHQKSMEWARPLALLYGETVKTREYVFEDVPRPYVTNTKAVIPSSYKYMIIASTSTSMAENRRPNSDIWEASISAAKGCYRGEYAQSELFRFLSYLGYGGVGGGGFIGIGSYPAAGVFSGLGELGRINQVIGAGVWMGPCKIILTNLPLPASNPIDAGIERFCRTACKKCAELCPGKALSMVDEPTYELASDPENPSLKPELFNNKGKKVFPFNHANCMRYWSETGVGMCGICESNCVFNKEPLSSIHEVVKPVISNTALFNGFFFNMDKAFGYGQIPEDQYNDWWHLEYKMPVNAQEPNI